jgi:hypothetical protein
MVSVAALSMLGNLAATTLVGPRGVAWPTVVRVGAVVHRFGFALGALSGAAIGASLLFDLEHKWEIITLVLIAPLCFWAGKIGLLAEVVSHVELRAVLIVIAMTMPSLMYQRRQDAGHDVAAGKAFDYVMPVAPTPAASANVQPLQQLGFIGHAGDVHFLWNPQTTALTLMKLDSKVPFEVIHWTAPTVHAPVAVSAAVPSSSPRH